MGARARSAPTQSAQPRQRTACLGLPEGDVLEAGWKLAERLEPGGQVAGLELLGEAGVVRPEQANVGDGKQHHGQALQAQAKGPGAPAGHAGVVQNLLLHHPEY